MSAQHRLFLEFRTLSTDFYILAIPVAMIRKLQIDKKKKISFMVFFLAGLPACIMSIVRLIVAGQKFGSSDSFSNGAVVSQYMFADS
ncbi:hypothetical protein OCU04_010090 [Sclerotinia nivalis]|uniref:Rhodopsin domain-containing protein n=1 Tax=Sclerotinia nivalis TaxID=352851 RepID=A0A9X0AE05_9HELO|nr:hypothetical protein OCU04_010090 [Sclerotinia nivalis]